MDPATAPTRGGTVDAGRTSRRRRWLRTDEGWRPGEDAVRIAAAVGIAVIAVGGKLFIVHGFGGELGYLTYLGAVALGAWVAGSRGGIITTVICALAELLLFSGSLEDVAGSPATLFRLALFLFDGALVTVLTSRLRRAIVREKGARAAGDAHLEARTAAHLAAERDRAALTRLQAVTASLAGAATQVEVAGAILDRGMTALGAVAGGVSRLDDHGRSLELIASRGYPTDPQPGYRFGFDRPSHLRDAVVDGRPVFLSGPEEWSARYPDSPPQALPSAPDGGAIAVLPLISAGRTIGCVVFRFAAARDFGDGTEDLALRLADQGAQALDRAMAYDRERQARQALERGRDRLAFLVAASELLGSGSDIHAGLGSLPRLAVPSVADWCVVDLLGDERAVLATAAETAGHEAALERLAVVAPGSLGPWLVPETLEQGAAIASTGLAMTARLAAPGDGILAELTTRTVLAAVIGSPSGEILGSVVFGAANPDRFGADDIAFARDLAGRIAAAAERSRLFGAVERFKATVDLSADAVFMFDPDTLRLTYVNRGAADLMGGDGGRLLGSRVVDLQRTVPESALRRRLADLRTVPGRSATYTEVLTREDGSEVPVDASLQAVTLPDGTRTGILTVRDITDRIDVQARLTRIAGDERRQAAELRAVIQAMGEGILVVDPNGRISLANEAASLILGDLPARFVDLEARLAPVTAGGDAEPTLAAPGEQRTVRLEDGRWLEIADYPADLAGGMAEGDRASLIVVIRDVTRARDAEVAREAFLGVLSHELRTPVTTIFGYAKVLQRPSRRADQMEMLSDIEVEADRLYRIVEDLLALSRVEGGITIEGEPLLIQHLAEPVVASEALRWAGVSFEIDLPPDLPAVFGERTYVEQVLRNLVSNAAKYSGPGTTVTIAAETTPGEVLVRVLDRGYGIDEDESDRLFELYYRSPNTARSAAGAGIGLYVGRGLITAMGGRIWARPRPGGGSEFGFSLPRCEEDPPLPGL